MKKKSDDRQYLDPVFLRYGQEVYSNDFAQTIREDVIDRKTKGKRLSNLIPQEGFQEQVCTQDADLLIVGGKKGGGKVLPNDADIITPFGVRKNGDIKVGDIITDPTNGGMERVIQIFEHKDHDFYEVEFDDGAKVQCGLEHLWKVRQTGLTHKRRHLYGGGVEDDYRIWTFGMIKKWLDEQAEGKHYMHGDKRASKKYLVIPLTEPVKFTVAGKNAAKKADFDPYVIGALIGDGHLGGDGISLTSADQEIVDEFTKAGFDMSHASIDKRGSAAVDYRIPNTQIMPALTKLGLVGLLSADKFIPTCYKFGTVEERWAIVQGLMDTDGYIDSRGHCSFTTISEKLAKDFQFVVRSLGASATLTVDTNTGYKNEDGLFVHCQDAYTVYIKHKDTSQFFRLSRKKALCKEFNGGISEVARRIVGYRYIGKKDGRCITVDSPSSLYLTNDFIVTHNTWVALFMAMRNMFNPDVAMYAFRRLEDDVRRGPWKEAKKTFRGFGTAKESTFEFAFLDGKGATIKMEHLADLGKVSDRFRGAELAYIDLEELPEHTRDDLNIIFDFLAVNRNTAGVKSQMVATCNPVGWKNKLRKFLEWYIDPETDKVIKERDGKKRYMFKYGGDDSEIAWGNTWQEVYTHPKAKQKIDLLVMGRDDLTPEDMIMTVQFIEGDYSDNKILQITDKRYISRLASKGDGSVINDLSGVWRDIDEGTGLLSGEEIRRFFDNTEQRGDGIRRASCDVAIVGDFFVIWCAEGRHIIDLEAWFGEMSDAVIPFIEHFLKKNEVQKKNFTFDANGLGVWLSTSTAFRSSRPFNNKSAASDPRLWNNLKSESAEKWVREVKQGMWSIDSKVLDKKYTDKKGHTFTIRQRLDEERLALKRKDDTGARFEIIEKKQMKIEVGHSPDFIEGLIMFEPLFELHQSPIRKGFNLW